MPSDQWHLIEAGLVQRLSALNLFIDDVYHDQRSVSAGVVPSELVAGSPNFRRECVGVDPPGGIWAHICGSDLIRDADGTVYVLEDNLRVPSGVSYLLENRMVAKHVFPELFRHYSIEPVDPYIGRLAGLLASVSPSTGDPTIVVLTPGIYNSAYFEHAFLAQQLGVELVEGSDLVVLDDDCVYARTIDGLQRVDVIYRRIDDLFLDPEVFRPDSMLGVPGLMRAWRSGRVALVNAPGAGIADDKKVYSYVPDIIRFFLDEEPILATVPTFRCGDEESRQLRARATSPALVVKPANESGGYGVAGRDRRPPAPELADVAKRIEAAPTRWVAQPVISLSTAPTLCDGRDRPAARGSPPLHPARPGGRLRHPGRAHPGGPRSRFPRRQLVPGRWEQGHLGGRHPSRPAGRPGRRPRLGPVLGPAGTQGASTDDSGRRRTSDAPGARMQTEPIGRRPTRDDASPPTTIATRRPIRPAEDPPSATEEPTMLLARMAEAVYWAGRYLERAECTARIVQVHTDAHVDMPVGEDVGWEPLLAIAGVDGEFDEHYPAAAGPRRRAGGRGRRHRVPAPQRGEPVVHPRRRLVRPGEPAHRPSGRAPRGLGGRQQPVADLLGLSRRGATRAKGGSNGCAGSSPAASGSTASCSAP